MKTDEQINLPQCGTVQLQAVSGQCSQLDCKRAPEFDLILEGKRVAAFCDEHAKTMRVWCDKTWRGTWELRNISPVSL